MNTTPPADRSTGAGLALVGTALHAGLTSALLVVFTWYVPSAKRTFDEFSLALPLPSQYVVELSTWLLDNWRVIMPALPLLPVIDFAITRACGRCCRTGQVLWIAGVGLLLVALGIAGVVGVELPLMKVREGLAH